MDRFKKLQEYLNGVSKKLLEDAMSYREYACFVEFLLEKISHLEKKLEILEEIVAGKQDQETEL